MLLILMGLMYVLDVFFDLPPLPFFFLVSCFLNMRSFGRSFVRFFG